MTIFNLKKYAFFSEKSKSYFLSFDEKKHKNKGLRLRSPFHIGLKPSSID